jgi:hypothetical protein
MLFLALILSAILLGIANYAAARSKRPAGVIAIWGAVLSGFPCLGAALLPAVPILTVVLCLLVSSRRARFHSLSLLAFVAVFTLFSVPGLLDEREYARWRDRFP